jgi:putative protein kinase ArgK-like GTPase of G3E family
MSRALLTVIVETVGTGQSDVAIASLADTSIVVPARSAIACKRPRPGS